MNSVSKTPNFARIVVLIFMVKMFFFTAFFAVERTENIPQNIYDYSHIQYSSIEKLKRIRETNFDEWLKINTFIKATKFLPKRISKFVYNFQSYQIFSVANHRTEKIEWTSTFYHNPNLPALLNNRSYLRYQKLLL